MAMSLDLSRPADGRPRTRRASPLVAWPVSIAAHVVLLASALVIPLMAADVLPTPQELIVLVQAVSVPEPPLPPRPAGPMLHAIADQRLAPVDAPSTVGRESGVTIPTDVGLADLGREGGYLPGGIEGGIPDGFDRMPVQPPPVVTPVRPGGIIRRPEKIVDVKPVYPALALQARVQGVVIIEAVIGQTGLVEEASVLRSIPLLDRAALDAVRQWRYTPTLLNGVPVPVIMTVTVQFSLQAP
jgi:protein TonB